MVLPSPSNTIAANQLLFRDIGAKTLLFSPEGFGILEPLHEATKDNLRWIKTPIFEDLMSREKAEVFPFDYTFEQIRDKTFLGLHTSGTTGHPKYDFVLRPALGRQRKPCLRVSIFVSVLT